MAPLGDRQHVAVVDHSCTFGLCGHLSCHTSSLHVARHTSGIENPGVGGHDIVRLVAHCCLLAVMVLRLSVILALLLAICGIVASRTEMRTSILMRMIVRCVGSNDSSGITAAV